MVKNRVLALLVTAGMASSAFGIQYTDWTSATVGNFGSASGSIAALGITVAYSGDVADTTQTSGGIDYWGAPGNAFSGVANMPGTTDIITMDSAVRNNTITFSSPVVNPIMLILSQGRPNLPVYYDFDQDFVILSSGSGYWGGSTSGSLFEEANDVLKGVEGHGAIQFLGTFTTISWSVDPAEYWHGFTVGLPEAQGVPDGGMSVALLSLGLLAIGLGRRLVK